MIRVYIGSAVSDIPNASELPVLEVYPALLPLSHYFYPHRTICKPGRIDIFFLLVIAPFFSSCLFIISIIWLGDTWVLLLGIYKYSFQDNRSSISSYVQLSYHNMI